MSHFQKPFVSFSARFAANVLRAIQKDGAARLVSALVQQSTVVFLDPHSHLRHLAPTDEAYVWFSAYDLIDRERESGKLRKIFKHSERLLHLFIIW